MFKILHLIGLVLLIVSCQSTTNVSLKEEVQVSQVVKPLEDNISIPAGQFNGVEQKILYLSNINGKVAQCGCPVNPKGGVDRHLNFFRAQQLTAQDLVLDAGNALFSHERLREEEKVRAQQRAELILRSKKMIGAHILNVGNLDLSLGVNYLKEQALKNSIQLVSLNLVNPQDSTKGLFQTYLTKEMNGELLYITGLTDLKTKTTELNSLNPGLTLNVWLKKVPKKALVVVMADWSIEEIQQWSKQNDRALLWIAARELSGLEKPMQVGNSLIVQTSFQGQQWGELIVKKNKEHGSWFNKVRAENSLKRIEDLKQEKAQLIVQKNNSAFQKEELNSIEDALNSFEAYLPKKKITSSFYDFKIYPMTNQFGEKQNELSSLTQSLDD